MDVVGAPGTRRRGRDRRIALAARLLKTAPPALPVDADDTSEPGVREVPGDKSFDALAAAHSRALSRVSQDIADAVRTLSRTS